MLNLHGLSDIEKLRRILEDLVEKSGGVMNQFDISDAMQRIEEIIPLDTEIRMGDFMTRVEEE